MDNDDFLDLPEYASFLPAGTGAELTLPGGEVLARTVVLENIDETARRTLADRTGKIVAKRLLKGAVKTGLALGARKVVREATRGKHSSASSRALADFAGWIVFVLLSAGDRADTRSWLTLPANLQVVRVRLPAGRHTLRLAVTGPGGGRTGHVIEFPDVEVREGRITLVATRTLR